VKKVDEDVIKGFGDEWSRFDQKAVPEYELKAIFKTYFSIFDWDALPTDPIGFDLGCGTGRWANFVSKKVKILHCIDPSSAIEVAKNNLALCDNIIFHKVDVFNIPIANESMDFGYSLGVLHHISDTQGALRECVQKLKKGSPLLLYLYYSFENRSLLFKLTWRLSDIIRLFVSKCPMPLRYIVSQILALIIYWPLSLLCRIVTSLGFSADQIPLSMYKDKSFYTMRTDALDRFGTKTEKRFSKKEIQKMMNDAGLENIKFNDSEPYWCAVGTRKF
jgi:ubiquinone/menaquinone biosynthesis C-methylase UbiE